MSEPRIASVVLAAGLSTRLGRPKQLELLAGETLIERTVRVAQQAGLSPVFVVVLEREWMPRLQALGAVAIRNEHSVQGLASSIRVGVEAAGSHALDGLVLMTCDQVAMTAEHLRELCTRAEDVCGSRYAGKVGVPAYFPRSSFAALLTLGGDKGAKDLLRGARAVDCESLALDVDTEADLERAREFLAQCEI